VAVPFLEDGEWWHTREEDGPAATIEEAFGLAAMLMVRLIMGGDLDPFGEMPGWHLYAVEKDGSRRHLTRLEHSALLALHEQAFGGRRMALVYPDGSTEPPDHPYDNDHPYDTESPA
jgi:hypothetical protein